MASKSHADRVEQAFTQQAAAFEDAAVNRVFAADSTWITDAVLCTPDDLVLDVAAGTGHAARQLAPRVRAVIAFDATAAMLEQGRAAAAAAGLKNVIFCQGDAEHLPFADDSFDTIVSRFAFHHLERPEVVFDEIERCVRPAGQIFIADLIADDDPEVAARQNRLEILRDPSHTRLLSAFELSELHNRAGWAVVMTDSRSVERPLEPWLAQTATPDAAAEEIRQALRDELAGGPVTGFRPRQGDGGALLFTQTFAFAETDG